MHRLDGAHPSILIDEVDYALQSTIVADSLGAMGNNRLERVDHIGREELVEAQRAAVVLGEHERTDLAGRPDLPDVPLHRHRRQAFHDDLVMDFSDRDRSYVTLDRGKHNIPLVSVSIIQSED
jgi:hypothetical protein